MCKTYNSIMNSYIVDSIQTMMPTQMQMTPTFSEAYPFWVLLINKLYYIPDNFTK